MSKFPFKSLGIALLVSAGTVVRSVPIEFTATLTGPSESPANTSTGTGFATVIYDTVTHLLSLNISFSGLTAPTTASHIHAATSAPGTGTAGVATTTPTFAGFPLGVTSGTYASILDLTLLSSYNPAFVTANGGTAATAETALITAMLQGESYLNIHTAAYPGGEIRGFLNEVPDGGSTAGLMILAGAGVLFVKRSQRMQNQPRHPIRDI